MKSHINGWTSTAPSTSATEYQTPVAAGGASWSTTEATRRAKVPHAMTIDQLRITLTTAPGAAKSYAFTVMVNGVASALTVTVSGAGVTQAQDTTHSVALVAGDEISLRSVPTGTPTGPGTVFWNIQADATDLFAVMGFQSGLPTSGTNFLVAQGRAGVRTTAALGAQIVPTAGVFKNLYFAARSAPGAGTSWILEMFKNGVATGLTCTISGTGVSANDTIHTVSVVATDLITYQITESGVPVTSAGYYGASFDPTVDGESFQMFSGGAGLQPSVSATRFQSVVESGDSFNATESTVYSRMGATTLKALYVLQSVAPGAAASGKKLVYTVRDEVASTAAVVTILETATSSNITGQSIAIANDDRVNMQIVPTATPAATNSAYSILTFIAPASSVTVTPDTAALVTAAFAPVIAHQINAASPTALVLATFAPQIKLVVIPATAALTTSVFAPTVSTTANVTATPSTTALVITTFAPQIKLVVIPATAALTLATFAPSVVFGTLVTPGTAALTLATFAPQANLVVIPALAILALTAFAPAVTVAITPGTAALILTTFAPTVTATNNQLVTPGVAALTLTTFAPQANLVIIPGTKALMLATFAPVIGLSVVVVPGTAALTLTPLAPTVTASQHRIVVPDTAALVLTTFVPSVGAFRLVPISVIVTTPESDRTFIDGSDDRSMASERSDRSLQGVDGTNTLAGDVASATISTSNNDRTIG